METVESFFATQLLPQLRCQSSLLPMMASNPQPTTRSILCSSPKSFGKIGSSLQTMVNAWVGSSILVDASAVMAARSVASRRTMFL